MFDIIQAKQEHLSDICLAMRCIQDEVNDYNVFVPYEEPFIRSHIDREGFTLLALQDGQLAAFLIVDKPGIDERNLAFELGWTKQQAEAAAIMDSVGVLPAYRGWGLQKKLVAQAEDMLPGQGYTAFLATVYPDNPPSLNSFLALGYAIMETKPLYGGVLRHILCKKVG